MVMVKRDRDSFDDVIPAQLAVSFEPGDVCCQIPEFDRGRMPFDNGEHNASTVVGEQTVPISFSYFGGSCSSGGRVIGNLAHLIDHFDLALLSPRVLP